MKNINWYKYRQYLGYAIDLGRIFPLISKQKGLSKLIIEVSFQLNEIFHLFRILMVDITQEVNFFMISLFPGWLLKFSLINFTNKSLEQAMQLILR